jgi:PEP-CTERM motif
MSKKQRQSRNNKTTFNKRRLAYSLAAGAAAATSAGGASAEAAIVYSGPQNISIGQYASQSINLDGDSFNDILLKNYVFFGGNYQGAYAYSGQFDAFKVGYLTYVSALAAGAPVNSSTISPYFYSSMAYGAANPNAEFNNATDAYIGFSFLSFPNTYYAWMRVDVDNAAGTFVIKDWAYQDVAGKGITTGAVPEPGTLGLLAAGATGLLALRRRASRKAS